MSEINVKLNKRVRGIQNNEKFRIFGEQSIDERLDEMHKRKYETNPVTIATNKVKSLEDRIKILEMELQKARDESFKAGYEEGRNAAYQDAEKQLELIRIDMKALELKYLEAIEDLEGPLLDISKEMAVKIIGREVEAEQNKDALLLERLRTMMYEVFEQNKVLIEIDAMHLDNITAETLKKEHNLPEKMEINIRGNENLKPGEAFINSEDYFIDGRYKTEAENLRRELDREDLT